MNSRNAATLDPRWAWGRYEPSAERPWDLRLAGHLYRRAAFGATWTQLDQALRDGPKKTVDRLVRPDEANLESERSFDEFDQAAASSGGTDGLRAWWLRRMIETRHPLRERMTLFWHSHFGISNARVGDPRLMMEHVHTLRRNALGSYREMLEAVSNDPAVLLGLDAGTNRRAAPNENFVRQLMEQLSLGPGGFAEKDVREAARAFTGFRVLQGRLRYFDREHDPGIKNILGRQGNWRGSDVVKIVLDQPAAPRLLAAKLYRWLVSETDEPDAALLAPLAEQIAADYDVGRVVETILRSNLFFSPTAYRRRIKSPVEFALGVVMGLEGTVPTIRLGADLARLGQSLYHPPTVRGWPGGASWINPATLLERANVARSLLSEQGPYAGKLDPAALAQRHGRTEGKSAAGLWSAVLLQNDLPDVARKAIDTGSEGIRGVDPRWARECVLRMVELPEYQLS